jgi:uncharacterized protein YkwD
MSFSTRRWSVLAALALCVALVGAGCTKNGEAFNSAALVQNARHDAGLPDLVMNQALVDKAQAWAESMAARGVVSHSNLSDGAGPGWSRLGENVGWARSIDEMHSMFMNSPAHRASILNSRFNSFGTGVAVVDGKFYVVQVFGA